MVLPHEIEDALEQTSRPGSAVASPQPLVGEALGIGAVAGFLGNTSVGTSVIRDSIFRRIQQEVQEKTGRLLPSPAQRLIAPGDTPDTRVAAFLKEAGELVDLEFTTPDSVEEEVARRIRVAETRRDIAAIDRPIATILGEVGGISVDPILAAGLAASSSRAIGVLNTFVREARLSAALEIPIQTTVQMNRRELGLEGGLGDALLNVVSAGIGGGIFAATFKGLGRAARRIIDEATIRGLEADPQVRAAADLLERAENVLGRQPNLRTASGQREFAEQFDEVSRAILENDDPDFTFSRPATDEALRQSRVPDEDVVVAEEVDPGFLAAMRAAGEESKKRVVRANAAERRALREAEALEAIEGIETEVLEEAKRFRAGVKGEVQARLQEIEREFALGNIDAGQRVIKRRNLRRAFTTRSKKLIEQGKLLSGRQFDDLAAGKDPVERFVDLLQRRGIDPARVTPDDLRRLQLDARERITDAAKNIKSRANLRPDTRAAAEQADLADFEAEVSAQFDQKIAEAEGGDFSVVFNDGDEANPRFRRVNASALREEFAARQAVVDQAERCATGGSS